MDIFKKLDQWIKVVKAGFVGINIFEAGLVIIIGLASSNWNAQDKIWRGLLIAASIIYLLILLFKTYYLKMFPTPIIEELYSKDKLTETSKLFERQKLINNCINNAIQSLNMQTCSISYYLAKTHLCDAELGLKLNGLLQPILTEADVLLDSRMIRNFTIGLYLSDYRKHPEDINKFIEEIKNTKDDEDWYDSDDLHDEGIIMLRDDLNLNPLLNKDLLDDYNLKNTELELQTAINWTFQNSRFKQHLFEYQNEHYTINCFDIYQACSDDTLGVLFFVNRGEFQLPSDIEPVIKIFSNIIANYIFSYDSCVIEQIAMKLNSD